MPPPIIRTVNGIDYPRDVQCPDGFPPGWKGVEQAYGESSKSWGRTYVRYYSLDGKHRALTTPKGVIAAHCEDHGLDYDAEYAKYEKAQKDKAEAKQREMEAKGRATGDRREEMIAVSRHHFGELTGEIVFGFPGWRCRWDFLPESQQVAKAFTDPEDREFKLLKAVECMLGTRITQAGGSVPSDIVAMVEAGKNNTHAHELFHTGSARARKTQGSVELSAESSEVKVETKEQREQRISERVSKRRKTERPLVLANRDDYEDWPIKLTSASEPDAKDTDYIANIRRMLMARGFSKSSDGNIDFMLCIGAVEQTCHKYGSMFDGVYFLKAIDDSDRPVYQGAKISRLNQNMIVGLDRYIYWSATCERWEMGTMLPGKACLAFSIGDATNALSALSWKLLRTSFPSALPRVEPAVSIPASGPPAETRLTCRNEKEPKNKRASTPDKTTADTSIQNAPPLQPAADMTLSSRNAKGKKSKQQPPLEPTADTSLASEDEKGTQRDTYSKADKDAEGDTSGKISKITSTSPSVAKDAEVAQPDEETYTGADGRILKWDGVWHEERIWTHEECTRGRRRGEDLPGRPAHWPPDVIVCPGKWVDWLPPGWGQGKREEPHGMATKFISPEGKVYHDKTRVEKVVGGLSHSSADAPPWPAWLPTDWSISSRLQGGKMKTIFVQPHGKRFLWSKPDVDKCIKNGTVNRCGGIIKFKEPKASPPDSRT
eukprot:TRINITY_DN8858_c0_g1_i1.p1 TRINITY_DN8858_c0_g1~~TRINITY_DN8858_c0_g1_i1.p1  ORF type:complete len:749 (-),score=115.44 TRINITY_DN8858_c0_g1_i1:11-2158(-)